ncbi:MAG: cobalt ECF transporter T component CbiQ [Acidobacteriota bacterium]|nr:cobalt ECF transporter T component CbiQ [Acidobacteriota bacterium]
MKKSFVEGTISSLLEASHYAAGAEQLAASRGLLQRVDPRVKVAGVFALIVATAVSRSLTPPGILFLLALLLALLSAIPISRLLRGVWIPVLFFTGPIALPAIFLTPGSTAASFGPLTVTAQGLRSASFLISRAETAATLSALVALTTPWPWVMKALRSLGCPAVLVAILGMTFRYIFVILQTAAEMFESRKSRTVGRLDPADQRRMISSSAGVLMSKSLQLSGDVHLAMQSRGYRGEVHLLHDFRIRPADWLWLTALLSAALVAGWPR